LLRCVWVLVWLVGGAKPVGCVARENAVRGGVFMSKKVILDKISIYVPEKKQAEKPVQRLIRLGEKRDRTVNYLVVEAILDYLQREEKKS
jgi:hypothetical protein